MTDSTGAAPDPGPDFLDRLLARHRPAAPARPGVARVQPRLAGPFERVEAVRGPAEEPEGTAPLWPTTRHQPASSEGELGPSVPEVRRLTERERTVVRTEREPATEQPQGPRPALPAPPAAPLLRPAAAAAPRLRPAPDATRRTDRDGAPAAQRDTPAAPSTPAADGAAAPGPAAPLRPSGMDTAAAREAVRQSGARRRGQPPEQVVQVQIGRLEVTSAGQSPAPRRPAARERREATVSLSDYLARGRE
ncbi:hypothetical protein QIS99_02190 [Streptomyces sp. B-S-A8]|uniref:Uncharacterized protein n=1 Tax=Streptomyces solicavernae TaxID=3043614 RepID=A0ABT6RKZ6_9ACTN|nr:hypothetical protein [Streptomyces sp. B-S-A8]MDI3385030.1 hypothetical protein [Streptomyces sp. B-S-A8]